MANRVEVQFGASTGELKSAVAEVNSSLDTIKQHASDVADGFSALAAIAGVALSFEGLKSGFDQLAAFADQIQGAQARMGGSLEDMTTLSGVAKMAGVSFQSLTSAVAAANLQVQKSTTDAYGPAAQGLKALGLSAQQLQGLPVDQWFAKVSDAVARFNPSATLTANVSQTLGSGMASLMPLLLQGSDHFRALEAAVREAQQGLSATLPGISETEAKLNLLSLRSQAFAAQVFTALKPAIDAAIDGFGRLTQSITVDDIRDAANRIANGLIDIAASVARFFVEAGVTVDAFKAKLSEGFKLDLDLGGIEPGSPIMKAIEVMAKATGNYDRMKDKFENGISFNFNTPPDFAERFGAGSLDNETQSIDAWSKRAHDAIDNAIPKSGGWQAMSQDLARINTEANAAAESFTKLNAQPLATGGREAVTAQASKIEAQITAERSRVSLVRQILDQDAANHKISEQQKALATETAIEQSYQAEMALIARKEQLYGGDAVKYADVEREKAKLTAQYQQDMVKTVLASQAQMIASIEQGLQTFTGAFNSQIRGLLAGTTSWAQAMKSIAGDLFLKMIEGVEGWAVKHASVMLADSLLQKTQAASAVVTTAAAEAAKTEAVLAGTAARTAAETTGSAAGLGAQLANAATSILIDAGKVFAGVFGFLAPVMGPAASGPAEASAAAATAGGLTGLAVGAWEIPSTQPYLLHPGEMVVPQTFASGLRGAISGDGGGGGSGGMVFAPNFSGFIGTQSMINQILPQLARQLRAYQNLNPSVA